MRVAPFGNPRINGYLLLPEAYRSLSRPSSAPDAKAFPLRSFQLDQSSKKLAPFRFRLRRKLHIRSFLLLFRRKLVSGDGDGSHVSRSFASVREILVLLNYAGLTDFRNCNRYPSIRCSTIKITFAFHAFQHENLSVALLHLLSSHCSVFKVQLPTAFAVRFEDPTSVGSSNPAANLLGGPEWARTTDLTIISRTL